MSANGIVIPTAPQFSFQRTVPSHGWLMLAPFRWHAADGTLSYAYQAADGSVLRLLMREADAGVRIDLPDCPRLSPALESEISLAVRRMLNIDWDLHPFYTAMRAHAGYDWIERERQGRLLVSPSLWEDLAKVLLTTNTGWAQTVSMSERLCQLGAPHPTVDGWHAFPSAQRIAEMSLDALSAAVRAGYRSAYLHQLARKIASGAVDLAAWRRLDSDGLYDAVKSLQGFGDYAARTIATMYGHFDKIAIDSSVRSMFAAAHNAGEKASDEAISARYEAFGAWSGLVLWLDNKRYWSNLG